MNVTLWDTSSDVRKELSIQDDRTESDNRIEVTLLIGIAENNLPHIVRWESTKPPYAEPHVRWCGRSVNVKIGGECLLWLAFTSYPIISPYSLQSRSQVLQETKNQSLQVERFDTRLVNLYCAFLPKWQKYFSFICCVCLRFESAMRRMSWRQASSEVPACFWAELREEYGERQ